MTHGMKIRWNHVWGLVVLAPVIFALAIPSAAHAQEGSSDQVTFSRDIAPILQRSCQNCHRPAGVAPMPLVTYRQVRRWASRIREKTAIRDRAGAMPPWYMEKDIGIQHYKYDPSLSDEELATIAAWADNGAPEGDPADLPTPLNFENNDFWTAGEPDLIVETEEIFMEAGSPDWWDEDQVRGTSTGWPVHEVGRNADIFDPEGGRLLRAGSSVVSNSIHLHSSGRNTTAKLLIGFRFHPEGYEPKYRRAPVALGNAMDIDIEAMEDGQELHAYEVLEQHTKIITFEPHLHAPGERMCLEAIWGYNVETLSCVGYDHTWVRAYTYEDGYQPLLPKGTILHIVGYMDNTPNNTNITDPRNWQGSGNRSVANMFIDLGMRVTMSDEQFMEEMAARRELFDLTKNDHVIGCPLCLSTIDVPSPVAEKEDVGVGRQPGRQPQR